jgi:hypothetical protein
MEGVQEIMTPTSKTKKVWDEVTANRAKLDGCSRHNFVPVDIVGTTFAWTSYRCANCGGTVDAIAHAWYQRGIQHGTWPNLVAPAQYEDPAPGWEDPKLPDMQLIWKLARQAGYAVGIHGSLKRDFDLIAAPWTDKAVGNADLVAHLCAGLNAVRIGGPEHKPLGRVAVTLQIDGYIKPIDLSIMPRSQP